MASDYAYLNSGAPKREPLSVSDAMNIAKHALEGITLSVVGEISDLSSNPRYKAVYFTLADKGAALPCLMWRSAFDRLGIELKSGMQVEVRGRFSLYSAKGRMQFDVRQLSLAGEGQLRAQVAALAAKLRTQGFMEESRKSPLPVMPETIALVTSPQGKAVHDVLRTLRRRFPLAKVLLFGVKVEGTDAPSGMVRALEEAQLSSAEVLLLVRGGGSYEDLMPFNDETLALAIANSKKPIVTGIGHEPDTSIADMVASLRASTPTAAAEAVVPDIQELQSTLLTRQVSLDSGVLRYLERHQHMLESLQLSPVFAQERFLTAEYALTLEQTTLRLDTAIPTGFASAKESLSIAEQGLRAALENSIEKQSSSLERARQALIRWGSTFASNPKASLAAAAASMESLSPLAVLSRGYSLSSDEEGRVVQSVEQLEVDSHFTVQVSDGIIHANVVSKEKREGHEHRRQAGNNTHRKAQL